MFNKTNKQRIDRLVERLSNKEQSAISDIQREIQALKQEEKEKEERLADIQESYQVLLDAIDLHMDKWAELQELKEKALVIITE